MTTPDKQPLGELHIDVAKVENRIKISAHEQCAGEIRTVRQYDEIPISLDKINACSRDVVKTLNTAGRRGRVSPDILLKLREIGQIFSDDLLPHTVKDKIRSTQAEHLVLNLDDQVVHIPWELLHDGKQFLCQRFSMGRIVKTRQSVHGNGKSRTLANPLKMLILADPGGDLKNAYSEGIQLRDYIDRQKQLINSSLRTGSITPEFVKEKIRNFDVVHFAGHADYDQENPAQSGWRLTNGRFKAQEIIKMAGTNTMPSLIFSNACQSARTEEWLIKESFHDEIFGLANAFILSGVKHYVGTFWEIMDEPGMRFALEFYKKLFSGLSIGESLKRTRLELINTFGEETIVWASYLLYGDPVYNYVNPNSNVKPSPEYFGKWVKHSIPAIEAQSTQGLFHKQNPPSLQNQIPEIRGKENEDIIDFSNAGGKKNSNRLKIGIGIILVTVVLLLGYLQFIKQDPQKFQMTARTAYLAGNFEKALEACQTLDDISPDARLTYLIRGNIYFRTGRLDEACIAYQKALQANKGTDIEKAEAFIGLGRIASIRKQPGAALEYYRQAGETAPHNDQGYLAEAMILAKEHKYEEAIGLLQKARKISPNDMNIAAVENEIRKKIAIAKDQEKQERIDRLIKELTERMNSPQPTASDVSTPRPLTLWVMDFESQGYSLHEGEEQLLTQGIIDHLIQNKRIHVVERASFDRLLEELKLGSSHMTDKSKTLSLGKITAARLILIGRIIYSGPQTTVSFRLVETETGEITASGNESFGNSVPASILSEKLSAILIGKLNNLYSAPE